jgi:hypothetical protein
MIKSIIIDNILLFYYSIIEYKNIKIQEKIELEKIIHICTQ